MIFTIDPEPLMKSRFPLPDPEYVCRVILENNLSYLFWHDPKTIMPAVKCDQRPRDMPFFGIRWIEVK